MIKLAGVSSFQWSSTEQAWPFEKAADGSTLYCKELNLGYGTPNTPDSNPHSIPSFSPEKLHSCTVFMRQPGSDAVTLPFFNTYWQITTTNLIIYYDNNAWGSYEAIAKLIYAK